MRLKTIKFFLIPFLVLFLTGCGSAQIKLISKDAELSSYKNIHVANVSVSSVQLQSNLTPIIMRAEESAKLKILETIRDVGKFRIVNDPKNQTGKTLIIQTKMRIDFGVRALRWLAGPFGAGKGTVKTTLKAIDSRDESIKLEIKSESELKAGFAGGDMRAVIDKNIIRLVELLKKEL